MLWSDGFRVRLLVEDLDPRVGEGEDVTAERLLWDPRDLAQFAVSVLVPFVK